MEHFGSVGVIKSIWFDLSEAEEIERSFILILIKISMNKVVQHKGKNLLEEYFNGFNTTSVTTLYLYALILTELLNVRR